MNLFLLELLVLVIYGIMLVKVFTGKNHQLVIRLTLAALTCFFALRAYFGELIPSGQHPYPVFAYAQVSSLLLGLLLFFSFLLVSAWPTIKRIKPGWKTE